MLQAKLSSAEDELEARGQAVADLTGQASAAKEQHSALQAEIDKLQARPPLSVQLDDTHACFSTILL